MKNSFFLSIFLLLFIFINANENPIEFSSKKMVYFDKKNIVILNDDVMLTMGNLKIKGDSLIFYTEKNLAKCFDSVEIISKSRNIKCDSVYYSMKSKKGVLFGGESFVEKGTFKGNIITQDSNRVLRVYDVRFTTCDRNPPHYYFSAKQVKMYEDNYALIRPLIMYVHDIPVFYAPFWFFPVREERHSGFLVPNIGAGNTEGKFVKNISFFWAINPFMDATFSANITEYRGIEGVVDFEYLLKPYLEGNVKGAYIKEFSGNSRWRIEGNHKETFLGNGNIILNGKFSSDNQVIEDYNDSVLILIDKEVYSYLSISKRLWKFNSNVVFENMKNLESGYFLNTVPTFNISLPSFQLFSGLSNRWYGGTYFNVGEKIVNKYDTLSHTFKNSLNSSLTSSFKLSKYLNLNHSLSASHNYTYDSLFAQDMNMMNGVSINTKLYGFTRKPVFNIKKIRHTLSPSIGFSYRNYYISQDTSYFSPISISINNLFEAKLKKNESVIKLFNIGLSSSYSVSNSKFSNISISADTKISHFLNLRGNSSFDPYNQLFQGYSISASSNFGVPLFKDTLSFGLVYNINKTIDVGGLLSQTISIDIDGHLTKGWAINYSNRIDITKGDIIEQRISAIRDLHCWELSINYTTFGSLYRVDANLHIKKLPTVQVGKGLFDIFGF
jgi:lipopolysaccharide assembly outer membrane protein LptD (OstA)